MPTMSQTQIVGVKTVASVERARDEVNSLKTHAEQLMRSESPSEASMGRLLAERITQTEAIVAKAEKAVRRIKNVRLVPPRPTASVPPAVRAQRALSVLRAGLESGRINGGKQMKEKEGEKDGKEIDAQKGSDKGASEPKAKKPRLEAPDQTELSAFLSAAGKPPATPLREDTFAATLLRISKQIDLGVGRMGSRFVGFECRNVFRAFVWFKEVPAPSSNAKFPPTAKPSTSKPGASDAATTSYIVPEHIGCFGIDEANASRWSCSRHAVFTVLTERANAAIRFFMSRERTGEDAFFALATWLAGHRGLFSAMFEERCLAFDASRGIFLPACIYPFEGNGDPRFTRGSIPLRSNSNHGALSTMRVPSSSQAQAAQAAQAAQQQVQSAHVPQGQGRGTAATVAAAAAAAAAAAGTGGNAPPSGAQGAGAGGRRTSQGDMRNGPSRSKA